VELAGGLGVNAVTGRAGSAPSARTAREWLYVKVFVGPSRRRLAMSVLDYARPAMDELLEQRLIDGFFYIAYLEGGPHLRLRVSGDERVLQQEVRSRLEARLPSFFAGLDGVPLEPHPVPLPLQPFPALQYDRYDGELEAFGGPAGLVCAERHFQDSSVAAFHLLEAEREGRLRRLEATLVLVDALGAAFQPSGPQRASFYDAASRYWVQHTAGIGGVVDAESFERRYRALADRLEGLLEPTTPAPAALRSLLTPWRESAARVAHELHTLERDRRLSAPLSSILHAFIHLLHNRVLVFMGQEAFNLYVLSRYWQERR
jgi:thiopeptide-type bacteriocin biosynthesis protein